METVILVDLNDQEIGICEKIKAHQKALLHRAFSVFLYRGDKILLQQRAAHKYHCGSLWTNTCCSHPRPGETTAAAAQRRLQEELGIVDVNLTERFSFVYIYQFQNGLTEYEYDHVLTGAYDGGYTINQEEVDDVAWMRIEDVLQDMAKHPQQYTPWFISALHRLSAEL